MFKPVFEDSFDQSGIELITIQRREASSLSLSKTAQKTYMHSIYMFV